MNPRVLALLGENKRVGRVLKGLIIVVLVLREGEERDQPKGRGEKVVAG